MIMTNNDANVCAIIPAAGHGRRMGRVKQLMPMGTGGRAMLAVVLQSLADSELSGVVLVTRQLVWDQLEGSVFAGLQLVWNENVEAEMIDSVRLGLRKLQDAGQSLANSGVLIMPGDCPAVETRIVDLCIEAFVKNPQRIVIASYNRKGGHPMIFPQSLVSFVFSEACDKGLNALAKQHAELVLQVECDSSSVLQNVNTPDDLKKL